MFVYFLVRMRKCTWVSLKRPCSYIESVGVFWILFSCGFPHRNFLLLLLTQKKKYAERTQKKKETKLVSSFAWLCCCYYCGFMMHESRGNWTRRYGQPHGGRVHRGLLFFLGIFSGGYSSKGENPIFFFLSSEVKEVVSHQHNRDGTLDFSTARYYSPSRLHDVRSPCKDTPTSNTTASSFTTGRTVK